MPKPKFIAVLNNTDTAPPLALQALAAVIQVKDGATLISAKDNTVLFSGDHDLADQLRTLFADHMLIEEDQALAIDVPGPASSQSAVSNALSSDGDDKDPDEIVHF